MPFTDYARSCDREKACPTDLEEAPAAGSERTSCKCNFLKTGAAVAKRLAQDNIRRHARLMLKLDELDPDSNNGDECYTVQFASEKEIRQYELTKKMAHGPSVENFRVHNGSSRSPWNQRCGDVFSKHFVTSGHYACKDRERIAKDFTTHLKTILAHASPTELTHDVYDKKRDNRRDARRGNVGSPPPSGIPRYLYTYRFWTAVCLAATPIMEMIRNALT